MPEYKCECCNYSSDLRSNLTRHLLSNTHFLRSNSDAAAQMMDLKVKQEELKQQIKANLKNISKEEKEEGITYLTIQNSTPLIEFMENVINKRDITDYYAIANKETTFEDVFMEHVCKEYETNKSIVLDKYVKNSGISHNQQGVIYFDTRDKMTGWTRFITLIDLFHKYLKEEANLCLQNTEEFVLTNEMRDGLIQQLRDLITLKVS